MSVLTTTGSSVTLGGVATTTAQSYAGPLTLIGSYFTGGASFSASGPITLAGTTTISTGAGALAFGGAIDGASLLTLATGGTLVLPSNIGQSTQLAGLTITAPVINLGNVATTGSQVYNGVVGFNSSYATNGGDFTVNGNGTLVSNTSISTGSGGGDITFGGALNGSSVGAQSLTLLSGAGDIGFVGPVGTTTGLGDLVIVGANDVLLNDTMLVATYQQQAGSGLTDFGFNSLKSAGDVLVTAGSIEGSITGGNTFQTV